MAQPVEIVGIYQATPPSVADGQQKQVGITANGALRIAADVASAGGIAYTDKTITSLAGSSETLAAANTSRKVLVVQNTGNADVGVRWATAGTAAIGGAATMTLTPGQPITLSGAECPTVAVTVIGTAGQPVFCVEGV